MLGGSLVLAFSTKVAQRLLLLLSTPLSPPRAVPLVVRFLPRCQACAVRDAYHVAAAGARRHPWVARSTSARGWRGEAAAAGRLGRRHALID